MMNAQELRDKETFLSRFDYANADRTAAEEAYYYYCLKGCNSAKQETLPGKALYEKPLGSYQEFEDHFDFSNADTICCQESYLYKWIAQNPDSTFEEFQHLAKEEVGYANEEEIRNIFFSHM